jgi:hypothetical protein
MVANRAWLVVNETQEIEIAWETAALLARGFTGLDNKDFASIVWNVSASAELSLEEVATSGAGADELALLPEAEPAVPASPRTLSYSPTFPPRREGKVASPREKGALVKKNAKGGQGDLMSGPIAAKTVTSALAKTLAGVGLDAHVATFGKANILTLKTLQMHTLSQVEQSLKRPVAYGAKFTFSDFERAALAALGLKGSPEAAEQGGDEETTIADVDFSSGLFKSPMGPLKPLTGHGLSPKVTAVPPALQGCKAAAVMLNTASGELTVELVSGVLAGFAAATG